MVGCGHEIFIANQFSLSADLTGGLLLSQVKERVKYKLETPGSAGTIQPIASKMSYDTWQLVPNANASLNLWWYPVEGVQMRVGYQALTYFNTTRMQELEEEYLRRNPDRVIDARRTRHGSRELSGQDTPA